MAVKIGKGRSSLIVLMGLLCFTGCSAHPSLLQTGIVGGGLGAGTGAGIAALTSGSIATGAAIGGGVGVLAGVATGAIMAQQDPQRENPEMRAKILQNQRAIADQDRLVEQERRGLEDQYLQLPAPAARTVRYEYIGASRSNPYR